MSNSEPNGFGTVVTDNSGNVISSSITDNSSNETQFTPIEPYEPSPVLSSSGEPSSEVNNESPTSATDESAQAANNSTENTQEDTKDGLSEQEINMSVALGISSAVASGVSTAIKNNHDMNNFEEFENLLLSTLFFPSRSEVAKSHNEVRKVSTLQRESLLRTKFALCYPAQVVPCFLTSVSSHNILSSSLELEKNMVLNNRFTDERKIA